MLRARAAMIGVAVQSRAGRRRRFVRQLPWRLPLNRRVSPSFCDAEVEPCKRRPTAADRVGGWVHRRDTDARAYGCRRWGLIHQLRLRRLPSRDGLVRTGARPCPVRSVLHQGRVPPRRPLHGDPLSRPPPRTSGIGEHWPRAAPGPARCRRTGDHLPSASGLVQSSRPSLPSAAPALLPGRTHPSPGT